MNGPRQVGKRTFAQKIGETRFPSQYVTLDNATQPSAVTAYPLEFLRGHPDFLIVDEVQLAPELFRALKMVVDEGRLTQEKINGRYLLTGSANIFVIPKISEALVGRMSVLTLYPLAAFEVAGGCGDFIQRDLGLNPVREKHYRKVLEMMFLNFESAPWFRKIAKRLVKSPKGYFTDTSFLCALLN